MVRFSAIGDLALLVPVLRTVLELNTGLEVNLVSKPFTKPLFEGIDRLVFHSIDPQQFKGFRGLLKLASEIFKSQKPERYLDLHDSLRSNFIGLYMRFRGVNCFRLDKGRDEKKSLTRPNEKQLRPLKHTLDRYYAVFGQAGFRVPEMEVGTGRDTSVPVEGYFSKLKGARAQMATAELSSQRPFVIGYAPFAGMPLKEQTEEKRSELLRLLHSRFAGLKLVLFGSKSQKLRMESMLLTAYGESGARPHISYAFEIAPGLESEMSLISGLDLMISMDSANLHLAALSRVQVLGIFGSTHPFLGFAPVGQQVSGVFGKEDLPCRPCTVYGKGSCYRGDFACMSQLDSFKLLEKIEEKLSEHRRNPE